MKRFALWTLGGTVDAPVAHDGQFPDRDYSLFKHGDAKATMRLAAALAQYLHLHTDVTTCQVAPVFPVAYHNVPPAYFYLVSDVVDYLNEIRLGAGLSSARLVRITKSAVTGNHYATSDAQARRAELAAIEFTLAEPVEPGATVVALDDIRITGLAEEFLLACLHEAGVDDEHIVIGYVADVDDELASTPSVESAINRRYVTSVLDMIPSIESGAWVLNVRFLKDVLNSDEIEAFARAAGDDVVTSMIEASYQCGSAFVKAHAHGIAALERVRRTW